MLSVLKRITIGIAVLAGVCAFYTGYRAIIGELPSSIQGGLGGAIISFNQYYVLNPQNLWATNLMAAALGISFFLAVVIAEKLLVHRPPETLT